MEEDDDMQNYLLEDCGARVVWEPGTITVSQQGNIRRRERKGIFFFFPITLSQSETYDRRSRLSSFIDLTKASRGEESRRFLLFFFFECINKSTRWPTNNIIKKKKKLLFSHWAVGVGDRAVGEGRTFLFFFFYCTTWAPLSHRGAFRQHNPLDDVITYKWN